LSLPRASNWQKITAALFDQRFDGSAERSLLAICLPTSEKLTILSLIRCEDRTIKVAAIGERSAISAVSLRVTRDNVRDLLVVDPAGLLTTLTHGILPIDLIQPSLFRGSSGPGVEKSLPTEIKPVRAKDAVHSTVTIVLESGLETRLVMDCVPKDLLTSQCLQVLALALPPDCSFTLHRIFTQNWVAKHLDYSDGVQFECFCSALAKVFGLEDGNTVPTPLVAKTSPWERLSRSPSGQRLIEDPALAGLKQPTYTEPDQFFAPVRRPHPYLALVLNALHTLGEDLRLMVYRYRSLLRLAKLICRIALIIRPEWADYWKRLCPDAMTGWVTSVSSYPGSIMNSFSIH